MSAGDTPDMRDAIPTDGGFCLFSFSAASIRRPFMFV
jgi:hypothetical protein